MMNALCRRLPCLLLLLFWCLADSARAQESRPVALPEMVTRAQKIVTGRVISQYSAWDELHREIYTYTTIRVQEIVKSDHADTVLVLRHLGGRVGEIVSQVGGQPEFVPEEEVLVFLGPYPGTSYYGLIDWHQGKYVVQRDHNRQQHLRGFGPGDGQRVEQFVATLRRHL